VDEARSTASRADTAIRLLRRRGRGPRTARRRHPFAVPRVRRPTVFRHLRGTPTAVGGSRPAAGAHRHGKGLPIVRRPKR